MKQGIDWTDGTPRQATDQQVPPLMSQAADPSSPPPSLTRVLARLVPYLRPRWTGLALAGLGTFGTTLVDLAKPWPLKLVFDRLLGHGEALFGLRVDLA